MLLGKQQLDLTFTFQSPFARKNICIRMDNFFFPCPFILIYYYFTAFQPKYYGGDYGKMLEILDGCKRIGCTFLVGGRNVDGVFKVFSHVRIPSKHLFSPLFSSLGNFVNAVCLVFLQVLKDFDIPETLKDMFVSIPADRFRMDVSSTEIRKSTGL